MGDYKMKFMEVVFLKGKNLLKYSGRRHFKSQEQVEPNSFLHMNTS